MLHELFTEGQELHIRLQVTNYSLLFTELRRPDGSLVAFIHTGVFQPELIASLKLPIPWSLEPWCRHDGSTSATEALALHTEVDAQNFELSTFEEQTLEVGGRPFLLTVHYAAQLGGCSSENCTLIERAGGANLDAQSTEKMSTAGTRAPE